MDTEVEERLLPPGSSNSQERDSRQQSFFRSSSHRNNRFNSVCRLVSLGLILAILSNAFLAMYTVRLNKRLSSNPQDVSPYIGLPDNRSVVFAHRTDWWSFNETLADQLWEGLDTAPGAVALDHQYTDSKALPRGWAFPWDESKSVYFLRVYHTLHCLKMLQRSIVETRRGQPQSQSYWHMAHCLDAMRQDALCRADDTPMRVHPPPFGSTGDGQTRQCRDFGMLEAWAKQHTACFRFAPPNRPHFPWLEKFKYCPADSGYLPRVRDHFGYAEDWIPNMEESAGRTSFFEADAGAKERLS